MKILKGETYKNRLLIEFLRSPESIRSSCNQLLERASTAKLAYFNCELQKIPDVATYVIDLMLAQYPDLNIPYHSRWRHFEAGNVDRLKLLREKTAANNSTKSAIELVIISVLLDAGAGMQWRYKDHLSSSTLSKSEGLAVASFNLFVQGIFSSDMHHPYQVDALGLQNIAENTLANGLQVALQNPLVGLGGRLKLLHHLGVSVEEKPEYFHDQDGSMRLGNIFGYWQQRVENNCLSMGIIFRSLLDALGEIWPGRYVIDGVNLGDVWPYTPNITDLNPHGFVPFHKLTQWMCYSLIEPLEAAGIKVIDLELLTGLPEYRNGGLFVDLKVLLPKNASDSAIAHTLDSEFIVEWRAMTILLLDLLATEIRERLQLSAEQLPLIKILQGGTWLAGRKIAHDLRADGSPPFKLSSDGTLF